MASPDPGLDEQAQLRADIERLKQVLELDYETDGDDTNSTALHLDDIDNETRTTLFDDEGTNDTGISTGSHHDFQSMFSGEVLQQTPQACLALNLAYQELLHGYKLAIEGTLHENEKRQEELRAQLEEDGERRTGMSKKTAQIQYYSVPYFVDNHGMIPPHNLDVVKKRVNNEREKLPMQMPGFSKIEKKKLLEGIIEDCRETLKRPLCIKKEILSGKIQGKPDDEDRQSLNDLLEEYDLQLNAISNKSQSQLLDERDDYSNVDWMKISAVNFDGLRSPEACMHMWTYGLNPKLHTAKWSKDEDEKLLQLAEKYNEREWMHIAQDLGTNRTAYQCLQRYQTKVNPALKTGRWSLDEDNLLLSAIDEMRNGKHIYWTQVSESMDGRTEADCRSRFQILLGKFKLKSMRWKKEEDAILLAALHMYGKHFTKVAKHLHGRNADACRERYYNILEEGLNFGRWTYFEDRQIVLGAMSKGENAWAAIAADIPGRTDAMVRRRFRYLQKLQRTENCFGSLPENMFSFLSKPLRYNPLNEAKAGKMKTSISKMYDKCVQDTSNKSSVSKEAPTKVSQGCEENEETLEEEQQRREDIKAGFIIPKPKSFKLNERNYQRILDRVKTHEIIRAEVQKLSKSLKLSPEEIGMKVQELLVAEKDSLSGWPKEKQDAAILLQNVNPQMPMKSLSLIVKVVEKALKPATKILRDQCCHNKSDAKVRYEHLKAEERIVNLVGGYKTSFGQTGRPKKITNTVKSAEEIDEEKLTIRDLLMKTMRVRKRKSVEYGKMQFMEKKEQLPDTSGKQRNILQDHLVRLKSDIKLLSEIKAYPELGDTSMLNPWRNDYLPIRLGMSSNARCYDIPPIPPTLSTAEAFRIFLLSRRHLVEQAGLYHKPGILDGEDTNLSSDEELDNSLPVIGDFLTKATKQETPATEARIPNVDQKIGEVAIPGDVDVTVFMPRREVKKVIAKVVNEKKAACDVKEGVIVDKTNIILNQQGQSKPAEPESPSDEDVELSGEDDSITNPETLSTGLDKKMDALRYIRKTHDYRMLRARFRSLFLWPSLLSTLDPNADSIKECIKKKPGRPQSVDEIDHTIREKRRNNRYPCSGRNRKKRPVAVQAEINKKRSEIALACAARRKETLKRNREERLKRAEQQNTPTHSTRAPRLAKLKATEVLEATEMIDKPWLKKALLKKSQKKLEKSVAKSNAKSSNSENDESRKNDQGELLKNITWSVESPLLSDGQANMNDNQIYILNLPIIQEPNVLLNVNPSISVPSQTVILDSSQNLDASNILGTRQMLENSVLDASPIPGTSQETASDQFTVSNMLPVETLQFINSELPSEQMPLTPLPSTTNLEIKGKELAAADISIQIMGAVNHHPQNSLEGNTKLFNVKKRHALDEPLEVPSKRKRTKGLDENDLK